MDRILNNEDKGEIMDKVEILEDVSKNILKNKKNTIYCAFCENEEHYVVFLRVDEPVIL